MTSLIRAFVAAIALTWASCSAAQTVSLPIEEARALAHAAALGGRPRLARDIAAGILARDRTDRTGLIVLAAVEPLLGRPAQGRMAGVRAWRVSAPGAEKYEAARLTAAAAAREGRPTLAQIWLRRAAIHAPTEAATAQTRADFGRLRQVNPWAMQLSFNIAPSDNVNGGSSVTDFNVDGTPTIWTNTGSALALSGLTASLDASLRYRLHADQDKRTALSFRVFGRGVALSDDARATAPEAQNSDFSSAYAAVTLSHDRRLPDGAWGLSATMGGNWFGGDLAHSFQRVGISRQWQRPGGARWRLAFSGEYRLDDDGGWDSTIWKLTGAGGRPTGLGQLTYSASVEDVISDSFARRSTAVSLSAGLTFDEPLGPALISLAVGADARRYPDYVVPLVAQVGRDDVRIWTRLEATFADWSYAGFAPVVSVGANTRDSTFSRWDTSEVSVGLSFRSTF